MSKNVISFYEFTYHRRIRFGLNTILYVMLAEFVIVKSSGCPLGSISSDCNTDGDQQCINIDFNAFLCNGPENGSCGSKSNGR
jgi:hypothetical protein